MPEPPRRASCSPSLRMFSRPLRATCTILESITVRRSHRGLIQPSSTRYLKGTRTQTHTYTPPEGPSGVTHSQSVQKTLQGKTALATQGRLWRVFPLVHGIMTLNHWARNLKRHQASQSTDHTELNEQRESGAGIFGSSGGGCRDASPALGPSWQA